MMSAKLTHLPTEHSIFTVHAVPISAGGPSEMCVKISAILQNRHMLTHDFIEILRCWWWSSFKHVVVCRKLGSITQSHEFRDDHPISRNVHNLVVIRVWARST